MITVHRLTGGQLFVNAAHIVAVEPTPDTMLHLLDGSKLLLRDPAEEVCQQITRWFREVGRGAVVPLPKPPRNGARADEDT